MTQAADKRAEQTHAKIAKSAEAVRVSEAQQADSADRRTELAADRTVLAAERTYAAWVRTGLAALAAAIGARALLDKVVPDWLIVPTGCMLALFSGFCFVVAVWRELRPDIAPPKPDTRRLPAGLLLAMNGFLLLVSLAAFLGLLLVK
jgi:putative membrane protein